MVTFEDVRNNEEIKECIRVADETLKVIGYTEHSFVHAGIVSQKASRVLEDIGGYSPREIELARIAGYIHDIGNMVNRECHAQTGAVLAYQILTRMGMEPHEVVQISTAIGNHDEGAGYPVTPIAAALILADKSDVRRSRVRKDSSRAYDIHDSVNSAVEKCDLIVDREKNKIILDISIDTEISSVMDYFEIFLGRMMMCKKSAEFFGMTLRILCNGSKIL